MSASALLLRILLCVALILNGSGYAAAATGMELAHLAGQATHHSGSMPHAGRMDMAAASAVGGQMPCHEPASGPPEPAADTLASMPPHSGGEIPGDAPDPGCCPSSHCVCLQQLTATVPQFVVRPPVVVRATALPMPTSGRAAPPIPHPIRPPIG